MIGCLVFDASVLLALKVHWQAEASLSCRCMLYRLRAAYMYLDEDRSFSARVSEFKGQAKRRHGHSSARDKGRELPGVDIFLAKIRESNIQKS